MARLDAAVGTPIAYSTAPGEVALDSEGQNSPFTTALLQHLDTPGLEVSQVLRRARSSVLAATKRKQVLWDSSSPEGGFYFKAAVDVAAGPTAERPSSPATKAFDDRQMELVLWDTIKSSTNAADFQDYLKRYPQGTFAGVAKGIGRPEAAAAGRPADRSRPAHGLRRACRFFP